jgi:hypothetical protein
MKKAGRVTVQVTAAPAPLSSFHLIRENLKERTNRHARLFFINLMGTLVDYHAGFHWRKDAGWQGRRFSFSRQLCHNYPYHNFW